jgi:hypothetical protein
VDRHAGHRIPLHPPKTARSVPITTAIRQLAQALTEPLQRMPVLAELKKMKTSNA